MQIAIIALMSTFVYALVALGFTLVFGILRVVNFAHGEFYMLGAYAMYVFYGQFGWPYLPLSRPLPCWWGSWVYWLNVACSVALWATRWAA
ncbi:ABC transporter permease [Alcaligenes sp. HPC1271]|nr:ABC transporter permease [Alcaligenes sp. HPC1271]